MAELHSCYPSSPSDKKKKAPKEAIDEIQRKCNKMKSQKERPPGFYSPARMGGNFPTSVAARKSITVLSHFSTVFETGRAASRAFGRALTGQAGPVILKPALRGAGRAYGLKACGLSNSLRAGLHI